MRKVLLWALTAVCGCANYQAARVPQPPGPYIPAIYAAAQINHAPTRNQTLRNISYRKDLTEAELDYLLCLLAIRKGPSDQLKDVLLTVLKNPAATYRTKQRISSIIPNLGLLPLDQKEIVDAMTLRASSPSDPPADTTTN